MSSHKKCGVSEPRLSYLPSPRKPGAKSAFQNPVGDKLVASNSVRISASIPSFRGVLIPLHTSSDGFEMRSKSRR